MKEVNQIVSKDLGFQCVVAQTLTGLRSNQPILRCCCCHNICLPTLNFSVETVMCFMFVWGGLYQKTYNRTDSNVFFLQFVVHVLCKM